MSNAVNWNFGDKYKPGSNELETQQELFKSEGRAHLNGLIHPELLEAIRQDTDRLLQHALKKNFVMPAFQTPRYMSTVGGRNIAKYSDLIPRLCKDPGMLELLGALVGRTVYPCTHPEEYVVINYQSGKGQTHGWHTDDPQLALVSIIRAPKRGGGGKLEIAYPEFDSSLGSQPNVVENFIDEAQRTENIRREHHDAGDCYLLNAADLLHRVAPLADGQERCAINMAFAYTEVQEFGDTADLLYS